MTIEEANNRGWNLAVAAFAASLGVAVAALIPTEDKLLHKVDETLIPIVFPAFGSGTSRVATNTAPLIPLGAISLGLVLKLIWLAIEFNDKEAPRRPLSGSRPS